MGGTCYGAFFGLVDEEKPTASKRAPLRVVNDFLQVSDSGDVSVFSLLDLSAAFDTIDQGVILRRLSYSFGLGGAAKCQACFSRA